MLVSDYRILFAQVSVMFIFLHHKPQQLINPIKMGRLAYCGLSTFKCQHLIANTATSSTI